MTRRGAVQALGLAAAGLICVGAGIGVGQLPVWGQLAKAVPAVRAANHQALTKQVAHPAQGIQVHGWWTVSVYDQSGNLVTERQFENALETGPFHGDMALATVLTHSASPGAWGMDVRDSSGVRVFEARTQLGTGSVSQSGAHIIVLANSTPAADTNVASVETEFFLCGPTVTPSDCAVTPGGSSQIYFFTATSVTPIPVAAGQQVQVKVDISFS